ncbi:ribosome assembly cofactor RimP [Citricoccus sp.]|uniref:ribosome maturation factor RimP n=1 Tax=Citricoccus sp. TaxID=1978372 RepID=UPI0028BECCB9|nr:ribosome assembly cofactor RimP [Citricoccus sp.]
MHDATEHTERTPLAALVAPAVESTGLHFEAATVGGEPNQLVLTVVVDHADGTAGLDLDEVAEVALAISAALDAAGADLPELGIEPYQLEVSSPGVERPLTEPRHWRRNVGRLVTVEVRPDDGPSPSPTTSPTASTEASAPTPTGRLTGRIQSADEAGVVLVPVKPGAKKGMSAKIGDPVRHDYGRLGPATVQVELTRGGGSAADEELNSEA